MKNSNRRDLTHLPRNRALSFRFGLALSGAAFAVAVIALPAFAQAVPVPKAAPKARDAGDGQRPNASAVAPKNQAEAPPNPILPDLRKLFGVGPAPTVSFDANQKILASKVSAYISSIQSLTGNFVQVGPDGSRTTGDFYIQKPGKLRFEYDAPSPIALIADGTTLAVRDSKLATQDIYPLSQTPLRYLLSDRIDLMKDTNVVGVTSDDIFTSVTIEEKQPLVGTSRLMLMIGTKDNQLKQWTVTDPQGYDTTVAVYNLDTTKKFDPTMFKIDLTNYQNTTNN